MGRPFRQRVSQAVRLVAGQRAGEDQNSVVREAGPKELASPVDEVVAVEGDQNPRVGCCAAELLIVGETGPAELMNAGHVQAEASGDDCDLRRNILVQQKPQGGHGSRTTGRERQLPGDSLPGPRFLLGQPLLDFGRILFVIAERGAELGFGKPRVGGV